MSTSYTCIHTYHIMLSILIPSLLEMQFLHQPRIAGPSLSTYVVMLLEVNVNVSLVELVRFHDMTCTSTMYPLIMSKEEVARVTIVIVIVVVPTTIPTAIHRST